MAKKTVAEIVAEANARKAEAEAKMIEQRSADRLGMKGVFTKNIAGSGPQKEVRDIQTGAMKDLSSGAAARRGAEAGLRAQIAGAGGRPGGGAAKRALARAGEAGVMGAGAQVAGSAEKVAGMAGKVRTADIGVSKADKTARMKFHQLRMGEELAREGMKAQVSAASAGRSCFIAGTMVTMADGSKKKIEHVLVGEKVLGLDNKVNTVLDYNRPPTAGRSLYSINDGKAFFTHEHPFYTLKGWKAINPLATFEELKPTEDLYPELLETTSLEIGDELVTVDGVVKIESIKEYEAEFFTQLYNFLLDGDHTYFADEYLVHNGGGKASGGEILKRLGGSYTHKNGKIKGPGTETSDSIKARLSDGEFVVNAKTVRGIGEALGSKGKDKSRQKGSAYLYALQSKYGDTKAKSPKGLIPGFFSGAQVGQLVQGVASSGLLGKEAKVAGDVAGAGMAAHESGVKAKSAKAAGVKAEARAVKREKADDITIQGAKAPTPAGQANAPKVMGPGMMPKTLDEQEQKHVKDGGEIKFGKGVKVRKKFLDSIGHKPFKHFEDKAEKDYKEGQTGYKNLKKRQNSNIPGAFLGMTAAVAQQAAIAAATAAAAAAKASADKKAAARQAERQRVSQAGVEAGKGLASSAQGIMKQDTDLKDGGSVIDRPKLNVKKLLKEPLGKEYRLPEYGDDIDAPSRKKLEPRSTKKPPPWMRKKAEGFKEGKLVKKWKKPIARKGWEDAGTFKDYLENYRKEYAEDPTEIDPRTGKPYKKYAFEDSFDEYDAKEDYIKRAFKETHGRKPNDLELESIRRIPGNFQKFEKNYSKHIGKGKYVRDPRTGKVVEGVRDISLPTKEHTPKTEKEFIKQKKEGEKKFKLDPEIPGMVKKLVGRKIEPKKIKSLPKILKEKSIVEKKIRGESVLDRLHKKNLKFPQKKPKSFISKLEEKKAKGMKKFKPFGKDPGFGKPLSEEARKKLPKGPLAIKGEEIKKKILEKRKQMAPVPKTSLLFRPGDKGAKKAVSIPRELQLEKGVPVEQLEEEKKKEVKSLSFNQAFADARKKGIKTFNWKGKDYNTKLKSSIGKGRDVIDPRTGKVVKGIRDFSPPTKEHTPETEKEFLKQKRQQEIKAHAAKVAAEGAARDKKDSLGDARGLEGNKSALKAYRKHWDKKPAPVKEPEEKESWWDKITGGDKAEAKRLGMDVETYKKSKKKAGKGTGLFGATEEDIRKGAASEKPKVALKPKVVAPGVKKKKPEGMTDKEWANMGLAAGLTGLKAIAKSKQDAAAARKADKDLMTKARMAGGQSLSDFGGKVMQANMNLKKGGKVSFKDVLKAKKKMGY